MAEVSPYRMVTGVEISQSRYEELIAKEERLSIIEELFRKAEFVSSNDIKIILGIGEGEQ